MPDILITQEGISSKLSHLDTKKAQGLDKIPTEFRTKYAEWVYTFLS